MSNLPTYRDLLKFIQNRNDYFQIFGEFPEDSSPKTKRTIMLMKPKDWKWDEWFKYTTKAGIKITEEDLRLIVEEEE